jgi:two-component system chemotaxis response regulator CheY
MQGRAEELRALRAAIASGDHGAIEDARRVGMALRGSGATFGFPHLTEVATLVETARDEDMLRRTEGLIAQLNALSTPADEGVGVPEWLTEAAGLGDVSLTEDGVGTGVAWTRVARRAGLDRSELVRRVADFFGLEVADLASRDRAALRHVPEALMASDRILPLREDADTITVATADPTALMTERKLEGFTGRRPIFVVAHPEVIDALIDEMRVPAGAAREETVTDVTDLAASSRPAEGAILVVDDEPSARLLVRTLLERAGYVVVEAEDGVAALEAMGDGSGIGLVVADLNMPRMDGLELIWELQDAHRDAPVPVIVVTGEADEILETQLMEEGADDYIRKPIDPRLFLARVESTVRRVGARVARTGRDPENG